MMVLLSKMKMIYLVRGSGLFPVPEDRLNEVPLLKVELHRSEVIKATMAAMVWKLA